MRFAQLHASSLDLSRANCVNFVPAEDAVPTVIEVEDRHVEHKHWIVSSPVTAKSFSPPGRETSSSAVAFCF
jgi:DNA-binding helix-hairpin-helix protein with protein kinase domain